MKIRAYCSMTTTKQKRFKHFFDDKPKQYASYSASRLVSPKDATISPCLLWSPSDPESRPCSLVSSGAHCLTQAAPSMMATTLRSAQTGSLRVATHPTLKDVMTPLTSLVTSILKPVDNQKSILLQVQNQEATIVWCNA